MAPESPKGKGKGDRKRAAARDEARDAARQAAREARLKKLQRADDEARAAANWTAVQSAKAFLEATEDVARSGVVCPGFNEIFHAILKCVEPSCKSLAEFLLKFGSVSAAVSALPRWEVWFWLIYQRYEEMRERLFPDEHKDAEGDVGGSVEESPYYGAPTSPCYGPTCCSQSDVDTRIVQMIDNMLTEIRSEAAGSLKVLMLCDVVTNVTTLEYLSHQLVTRFTNMSSYLALSLDLKAYAEVTEDQREAMPHWERWFVGTYGSYQRLLKQLQSAKRKADRV